MDISLLADILVAVLAVVGAYALVRSLAAVLFPPPYVAVALEITEKEQVMMLAALEKRAREHFFLAPPRRPTVLIDNSLGEDMAVRELLEQGCACYHFVDLKK